MAGKWLPGRLGPLEDRLRLWLSAAVPRRAQEPGCPRGQCSGAWRERLGAAPRGCNPAGDGAGSPVWVGVCCGGGEQTCVGAGVPLEFVAPREPLSTEEPVADEGPLASVQAHVGPQQGRLPESLATVGDMAHVLLLALLSRPGNGGRGGGKGMRSEGGRTGCREDVGSGHRAQRRAGQRHGVAAWSPLDLCPRKGLGERARPGCRSGSSYLLSPSLQLGHVQAMRRRFSPGWASPDRACSICSWIWVGLSPLMVRLFPETFCTVSCCCPVGSRRAWSAVRGLRGRSRGPDALLPFCASQG